MSFSNISNMCRYSLKLSYPGRKYIPELDGARGLAVLLVMVYHCFPGYMTGIGWIGVDLFFVLSGFLITGILLDTKGGKKYYANFIGRRFLRIFPLYYLVLFIIFILVPAILTSRLPHDLIYYLRHQSWFWFYAQNWLYSIQGFPQNHLLVHFWSLGVEEQFYLVWPLVILFVPAHHLLKVSVFLCAVAIIFRLLPLEWLPFSSPYRYMNTVSRMDALLIGAIIAQLIRKDIKILEKTAIPIGISGLIVFIIGTVIIGSQSFMDLPALYTAIDLFMGLLLLLSFSKKKRIRKIMRYSLFTFFGKYSYGLYVYHYIIYISLLYFVRHTSIIHFSSYLERVFIIGPITFILAIIASMLSYHFFEIHFLKLKTYFRHNTGKNLDKALKKKLIKVSS